MSNKVVNPSVATPQAALQTDAINSDCTETNASSVAQSNIISDPPASEDSFSFTDTQNPHSDRNKYRSSQISTDRIKHNGNSGLRNYNTELFAVTADDASKLVKDDKKECQNMIKMYAVDGNEFLHLLERWTQGLMDEYIQQEESFKTTMKSKWDRKELQGITLDANNYQTKAVFDAIMELKESNLTAKASSLSSEFLHNARTIDPERLRNETSKLIDDSLAALSLVEKVLQFSNVPYQLVRAPSTDDELTDDNLQQDEPVEGYLANTKDLLMKIKTKNDNLMSIICIAGLEKCGKSTFINALLGYDLLPRNIKRCTQITTELRPINQADPQLVVILIYYSLVETNRLINELRKAHQETDEQFQVRIAGIKDEADRAHSRHGKQISSQNDLIRSSYEEDGSIVVKQRASNEDEKKSIIEQTCRYIQDERYLSIIKKVTIFTDKLPGENYVLKDVPGCDSPIAQHRATAIKAIQEADAFLFLTDGQRPDLTRDQISVLKEIQSGHFRGMGRAIGIITKLDLCPTLREFRKHSEDARLELINKGFPRQNIFATAAHLSFNDEAKKNAQEKDERIQTLATYDKLLDGFEMATQAINHYITIDLPKTHLSQTLDLIQHRVIRYIQDAIQIGQRNIPYNISDSAGLDSYIEQQNSVHWGTIFKEERFRPTLENAANWQHIELADKRAECTEKMVRLFGDYFERCSAKLVNEDHMIKEKMYRKHDFSVLQMNRRLVEDQERQRVSALMMKAVDESCAMLARFLYETYVCKLEEKLNEICPEQRDIFRTTLTQQECMIETRALIRRVARPIINATMRWPHDYNDCRLEAGKELGRVAPLMAFQVVEDGTQGTEENSAPILSKWLGAAFEFCTSDAVLDSNILPPGIAQVLKILR